MLNKNLLLALMISLLTLFGTYYFSGSNLPLSLGQVSTLFISAFAWLCLMLANKPVILNQKQLSQKNAKLHDASELSHKLGLVFNSLQSMLGAQIVATESELEQVKSLINDAIENLVDSFISLESSTRIEQDLVMLLASNETKNNQDKHNPFREKQLKSKQLLKDIANKLNALIKDTSQNESACKALIKIENEAENTVKNLELILNKLGHTDGLFIDEIRHTAHKLHLSINETSKTLNKLYENSQIYVKESKDIATKINQIMDENASNIAMVAEEITITSSQIEKDVQTALKSLQFQDMTTQLITQCGERHKIMQSVLNNFSLSKDNQWDANDSDVNKKISMYELEAKLSAAYAKLQLVSKVRMKEFNVDNGSVELF